MITDRVTKRNKGSLREKFKSYLLSPPITPGQSQHEAGVSDRLSQILSEAAPPPSLTIRKIFPVLSADQIGAAVEANRGHESFQKNPKFPVIISTWILTEPFTIRDLWCGMTRAFSTFASCELILHLSLFNQQRFLVFEVIVILAPGLFPSLLQPAWSH